MINNKKPPSAPFIHRKRANMKIPTDYGIQNTGYVHTHIHPYTQHHYILHT